MTKLNHDKLNEEFKKATDVDREFFSEYRNHANLYSGNHYVKKTNAYQRFQREAVSKKDKYQIRATRNHTNIIVKSIANSILNLSPGVKPFPNNPTETQDVKAADLHNSVWQDYKSKNKFNRKLRQLVYDLCIFGECWVFPYWDMTKGTYLGDQIVIDPLTGEEIERKPQFTGEVVLKKILPSNVRRDPTADSKEECEWIGYTELRNKKVVKAELPEELHKFLDTSEKESSYTTFDHTSGKYRDEENMVEINHVFYRPSARFPKGAYCTFTKAGKLYELDELPLGIFPLLYCDYDELPGSARAISGLRQGGAYQRHINYLISQRIKTMLTLGDDKLIVQAGTEVSHGEELPGIRAIKVNGPSPTILPGRSGEQYQDSLDRTIAEYYSVMGVQEMNAQKESGQFDPYAMLFRSAKEKARFSVYATKVEQFIKEICEVVLRLKKAHLDENTFIKIAGQSEYVNIPEFKNMKDLDYEIRLEEVGDDSETKVGKQLALNTIMQYSSGQLTSDQIGLFISEMPYLNADKITETITQPYERSNNIILALDRGEFPQANENDPHVDYVITSLYTRMSKADFKYLHPQIQNNYGQLLTQYEQVKTLQLQKQQQLEAAFIPTTGPSVSVDGLYEETIGSQGQPKSVRVKMPLDALRWLQQTLQQQGTTLSPIQNMPASLQAQLGNLLAIQNEQSPEQLTAPQMPPQQY